MDKDLKTLLLELLDNEIDKTNIKLQSIYSKWRLDYSDSCDVYDLDKYIDKLKSSRKKLDKIKLLEE